MKLKQVRLWSLLGLVLGLVLVFQGLTTYAFQDSTQHKTNEFGTSPHHRDVTLIGAEDWQALTTNDWQLHQPLKREIRVHNGVKGSGHAFAPLYVRISLKEFLELITEEKVYATTRYLLDEQGEIRQFTTQAAAEDFIKDHGLQASLTADQVATQAASEKEGANFPGYWYLAVKGQLPDKWRSGRLLLKTTVTAATSLINGVARADEDNKHHEVKNDAEAYTSHLFDHNLSAFGESQAFESYIDLGFSQNVISLADWLQAGAQPVAKWIVDTRNSKGWVYWGQLLGADVTTANLLEKVTLTHQPRGQSIYYAINARLEAIDANELAQGTLWQDLPAQLRTAWQTN
jgi:hypothetical protein